MFCLHFACLCRVLLFVGTWTWLVLALFACYVCGWECLLDVLLVYCLWWLVVLPLGFGLCLLPIVYVLGGFVV